MSFGGLREGAHANEAREFQWRGDFSGKVLACLRCYGVVISRFTESNIVASSRCRGTQTPHSWWMVTFWKQPSIIKQLHLVE